MELERKSAFIDLATLVLTITSALYLCGATYTVGQLSALGVDQALVDTQDLYGLIALGFISLVAVIFGNLLFAAPIALFLMGLHYYQSKYGRATSTVEYMYWITAIVIICFMATYFYGKSLGENKIKSAKLASEGKPSTLAETNVSFIGADGKEHKIKGFYLTTSLNRTSFYVDGHIVEIKSDQIITASYPSNL